MPSSPTFPSEVLGHLCQGLVGEAANSHLLGMKEMWLLFFSPHLLPRLIRRGGEKGIAYSHLQPKEEGTEAILWEFDISLVETEDNKYMNYDFICFNLFLIN